MESLKNWMRDTANILFDDSKNDLRSLPKTVRLQIHERLETQVEAMQNDQQDVLQDRRLQLHNHVQITTVYYLIHQQESLT